MNLERSERLHAIGAAGAVAPGSLATLEPATHNNPEALA